MASARRAAGQILDALGARGPGRAGRLRQPVLGGRGLHARQGGRPEGPRVRRPPSARPRSTTRSTRRRATSRATGEGRRAVVVLTDGVDTSSQTTPDEVIARSRALDVPIYAVSVVSPLDDPDLGALPREEGGRARRRPPRRRSSRYAALSGGAAFRVSDVRGPARGRRPHRRRAQAPVPSRVGPAAGSRPLPPRRGAVRPARASPSARAAATCRRRESSSTAPGPESLRPAASTRRSVSENDDRAASGGRSVPSAGLREEVLRAARGRRGQQEGRRRLRRGREDAAARPAERGPHRRRRQDGPVRHQRGQGLGPGRR